MEIIIQGVPVSLDELKNDVNVVKRNGMGNALMFTAHTVEALIQALEAK